MHYTTISFQEIPNTHVLIALWAGLSSDSLESLLAEMKSPNTDWDVCLLNTTHLVSREQINASVFRSIRNFKNGSMKAKSLDAEIIFNLSPLNNIMEAFKRFGVDPNCPQLISIRLLLASDPKQEIFQNAFEDIAAKLSLSADQSIPLDDAALIENMDLKKITKIFKLNDAILDESSPNFQADLTRLVINAALLRGY